MEICPSAQPRVDVSKLITEFCDNGFYEEDYRIITDYFIDDAVSYEDVINQMRDVAKLRFISVNSNK